MWKNLYMMCDETNSIIQENSSKDEDAGFQDKDNALEDETKVKEVEQSKEITAIPPKNLPREWRTQRDLSLDNIIGEISKGVSTRYRFRILCNNMNLVSHIEPRNINEALYDEHWLLAMHEKGKSVDESKYKGMIGSLHFLTASQPDIMLSVFLCARYQANPKESHLTTVKRIIKYLKTQPMLVCGIPKVPP